ncbi:bifunctional methylenetetrahydrofolate dehydrogenase/methenyltetrahydrofolate cyclohydrolase FolD [Clostridium minihomine]|uniref:bifunctional methylenetetrahydrofolate dehydrogenase/methenyltetrahydrofolate cyclohydrolase FolD n=1 Tax=Clostridium minihomine TaxID=2045012 RepID=UPI000C771B31|nr:bifunctional methylenetetrahydrofolate dehydrogenase/methenyltetrahydrofolate cyclohydrolase FolD [Clostridium minihomine]
MAQLIDGKAISGAVKEQIAQQVSSMQEEQGITPGLAVVLVGEDPASAIYVKNKEKACEEVGFYSEMYTLPTSVTQQELEDLIHTLNEKEDIDGILVQKPLPKGLDEKALVNLIRPDKDVDAFHPENVGHIMQGDFHFLPCTPAGVMELLRASDVNPQGKRAVIVGRSDIVGKPMAMLLLHQNATVTICHSKTQNLAEVCQEADILITAVGKTGLITGDMVKPGAVVIDVGINRDAKGKLCGDVDFKSVEPKASYITPVPGGVGPMTISMLLKNTLAAARLHSGL